MGYGSRLYWGLLVTTWRLWQSNVFPAESVILLHVEEQLGTTNKTKEARIEARESPRIRQPSRIRTI